VYYPQKLSSEFTKYINFIIQILFFYYEPDFNKLPLSPANQNLANMLKLIETNVSNSGTITKSTVFSHENINKVFGEKVDFKEMFEKVWGALTGDATLLDVATPGGIYVPTFVLNNDNDALRLSKVATVSGKGNQFLFIKAAVTDANNTLLLGAYEQYIDEIYSLERVYFWEDNTASNPDEYSILTFDEEIDNNTADGKFYLQDYKKGRRVLSDTEVKALEIRYAYYFYVKEDDDVKTNSELKINDDNFKGATEADNANDLYDKSITMNKKSKTAESSKQLSTRVKKAANAPIGFRSFFNSVKTWLYGWKSPE